MAKPISITVTGVAASVPVPLDLNSSAPFCVTLDVAAGAGVTFSVQFTTDPVATATPSRWVNHPNATAQTSDVTVMLVAPVTAVRLNQTAGATTSTFTVIQQGI